MKKARTAKSRDILLNHFHEVKMNEYNSPGIKPVKDEKEIINEQDYLPITIPINLNIAIAGDCLIWIHSLQGQEGYPAIGKEQAYGNRVAYKMSRGEDPKDKALHLCHRPYCIQPSHIYDGNATNNAADQKARQGKWTEADNIRMNEKAEEAAQWKWESPTIRKQQGILLPIMPITECLEHEFLIPASITRQTRACHICGMLEKLPPPPIFMMEAYYQYGYNRYIWQRNFTQIKPGKSEVIALTWTPKDTNIQLLQAKAYEVDTIRGKIREI